MKNCEKAPLHACSEPDIDEYTLRHQLQYNSIQSTAKSMEAAFDHGVMIAHAYSGRPEAPYTQKSKTQPSMCGMFKRTGTKQRCLKK